MKEDILDNETIKNNHVPGLKVGKTGLEKSFENQLLVQMVSKDMKLMLMEKELIKLTSKRVKEVDSIKLTIDTEVQKLSNELLKGLAGSISVMDIYTGEIIAMQSSPSFDPNLFLFGISHDDWQLIRNNPLKPLVNKTLSGLYSPGSTTKRLVIA